MKSKRLKVGKKLSTKHKIHTEMSGGVLPNFASKASTVFSNIFSKQSNAGVPPATPGVGIGVADAGGGGAGGVAICDTAQAQKVQTDITKNNIEIMKTIGTALKTLAVGFFRILRSLGTGVYQFFRSAPGEYITFIIFIILIFCGIGWLFLSDSSPLRRGGARRGGGGGGSAVPNWLANLNVDVSWLYKINLGTREDNISMVSRRVEGLGRCDDVTKIELNDKRCLNLDIPQTIEWNIRTADIPEWNSLPTIVQQKLMQDGDKLRVFIPWELVDNTFVPNCSKAYFANGDNAGYLFTDMNGVCKKKIISATQYQPQRLGFTEDENGATRVVNEMTEDAECQL